ncbi:hypothetical protein C2845_PM04G12770 [Panicum miliaceum]|uniref:Uncharacterized protein n=1 Tax=Panicum miliaceum TaxID=4540 RepID=A0A3L6QTR6_PANMI|nr:hypothetical protein C2845_PM04G12770 [Panicum miliaceum]
MVDASRISDDTGRCCRGEGGSSIVSYCHIACAERRSSLAEVAGTERAYGSLPSSRSEL